MSKQKDDNGWALYDEGVICSGIRPSHGNNKGECAWHTKRDIIHMKILTFSARLW